MAEEKKTRNSARGCIKASKGPWLVRRTNKDGSIITRHRFPSERERRNNRKREQNRRAVAGRIFAGLRDHGGYDLPKHADTNDLLIALCQEAGWHVEQDGTIFRKALWDVPDSISFTLGSLEACSSSNYMEYVKAIPLETLSLAKDSITNARDAISSIHISLATDPDHDRDDVNLALSL